ncbi:MAG TPA: hypothetical protein VI583_18670, partial [Cyclobacteriaceae bacterium]|nr:hypothetical protein [Cyclobacteriaceae bacterium]
MQRKKNIRSIVLLVILGSSAVVLALTGNRSGRKITNDRQFMIEDTVSVSRIVIEGEDFINTLERTGGIWKINEKYPADNSMVRVLMAVLHEVRVHRKAPRQMLFEITEGMKSKGIKVSVYDRQDLIHSFIAWGNGTSVSYFKEDESDPLVVHLPGYNSYVTGIFEVKENDWRDRLIVSTSWSGLKKYLLEYPGEINDGFTIISDGLLPSI